MLKLYLRKSTRGGRGHSTHGGRGNSARGCCGQSNCGSQGNSARGSRGQSTHGNHACGGRKKPQEEWEWNDKKADDYVEKYPEIPFT